MIEYEPGIWPDPGVVFPRAVVLWVRLRPDLEERCFEYWMFYRPDLGFNQSLAKECARRIDSLVNDGPDGPYTWTWIDDRYQAILVERGVITPEGELQLHPRG